MASKKKRNRPRPPGSRPPAKPPGRPGEAPKASGAAKTAAPNQAAGRPKAQPAADQSKTRPAGGQAKASRPRERTGPTRAERLAAAEAARRRKAVRTRALVAGGLVAVLALITVTVVNSRRSNARVVDQLEASGACNYDTRADSDAGAGRNHVSGEVAYEVQPPAGGDHDASAAPPGIFTLQSKPTDPRIVHAMEHGYVVLWHRADLDAAALGELRDLTGKYDRDILLVPREPLPEPVVATAWHRRLLCSRPDAAALERFVTAYRNKGPEKIPH